MAVENLNLLSDKVREDIFKKAKQIVSEHKRGPIELDMDDFWKQNAQAYENAFSSKRMPLGINMNWECVFDELGLEENHYKYLHDEDFRLKTTKEYNALSEKLVGKRLLNEETYNKNTVYPAVKTLADVFEAKNIWHDNSWWLEKSANSEDELKRLLDRVEEKDIRSFILPENWDEEKERLMAMGIKPPLYRGQRGPTTFAMSIYGVENLIYLIFDNEKLAIRFREAILNSMLSIAKVLDEEAGYTEKNSPKGFRFYDDNCAMLTADMYELFSYPILKTMFEKYAPNENATRYQHSDSEMAHLLPLLGSLRLTGVNFGPTLSVTKIREHCTKAIIEGQLAPFTFSRNEEENIVIELLRDFELSKKDKGVVFSTAGSINNGSRLLSMRLIMAAIERYCNY